MPVVLVKIPPTEGGPVHSTESDINDMNFNDAVVEDAVDQLDSIPSRETTAKDSSTTKPVLLNKEDDEDEDFETFQHQAQTMAMTERDGTTVVAATVPAEKEEISDTVEEIVVQAGDSTATALIESTLQHSQQDGQTNSMRSLSIRKLVVELKDAENMHHEDGSNAVAPSPHSTSALEEQVLQKGRFVSPSDFDLLKVIGMGAFGKVLQVRSRVTGQVLAMKVISKRKLKSKHGYIENVKAERDILTRVKHPFVVTMHCSFQTREKLFILMDFLAGGELFLRIGREGIFLEKTAAFYLAEIVLALDHLHSLGIIHRDLKPENVLLGSDGHVVLTDFGLAKDFGNAGFEDEEARALTICGLTICGTQEYMAPEMVAKQGYGRAADYWSLGCIAYEMLNGLPPFIRKRNEGSKDLFRKIMTEKVKMPSGASANACKLLKGLLNRNVQNRLGTTRNKMFEVGGVAAIKNLPFFSEIEWDKLDKKQVEPPENLSVENEHDLKHFHDEFVNMALPRSVIEMSKDDFTPRRVESENFRGFSFIQPGFTLPERDAKEMEAYWNAVEEDGESASEAASSKCGEEDNPPLKEPKKKRPPRKRKKKKAADGTASSTQNTPAPSAAGSGSPPPSEAGCDATQTSEQVSKPSSIPADTTTTVTPKNDTAKKEKATVEEEKKDTPPQPIKSAAALNPTTQAWTPSSTSMAKALPTPSVAKTVSPVSKPVAPAPKPAVSQWQSVGSSSGRNRVTPVVKQVSGQKVSNGWNTVPRSSGRGAMQQPRPVGNPWGSPPPPPPPPPSRDSASPSTDWRHHAMSPRTPTGGRTASNPQPQPQPQQQPQQQFWPSLGDPPLPSKTPKPKTTAPKLQGAWAGRG